MVAGGCVVWWWPVRRKALYSIIEHVAQSTFCVVDEHRVVVSSAAHCQSLTLHARTHTRTHTHTHPHARASHSQSYSHSVFVFCVALTLTMFHFLNISNRSLRSLIICPIAIAYSMGQIIKSVCVCLCVCPSASTLTGCIS